MARDFFGSDIGLSGGARRSVVSERVHIADDGFELCWGTRRLFNEIGNRGGVIFRWGVRRLQSCTRNRSAGGFRGSARDLRSCEAQSFRAGDLGRFVNLRRVGQPGRLKPLESVGIAAHMEAFHGAGVAERRKGRGVARRSG
jgi:hypothetical protein